MNATSGRDGANRAQHVADANIAAIRLKDASATNDCGADGPPGGITMDRAADGPEQRGAAVRVRFNVTRDVIDYGFACARVGTYRSIDPGNVDSTGYAGHADEGGFGRNFKPHRTDAIKYE